MLNTSNKACIYICRVQGYITKNGIQSIEYDEPKQYFVTLEPLSGNTEIQLYGQRVTKMFKGLVRIECFASIKEQDLAYLNGASPLDEKTNGSNANYIIVSLRPHNKYTTVYFERINKGE